MNTNQLFSQKYNIPEEIIGYIRSAYKFTHLNKNDLIQRQKNKIAALTTDVHFIQKHLTSQKHKQHCKEFECFKKTEEKVTAKNKSLQSRTAKLIILSLMPDKIFNEIISDLKI